MNDAPILVCTIGVGGGKHGSIFGDGENAKHQILPNRFEIIVIVPTQLVILPEHIHITPTAPHLRPRRERKQRLSRNDIVQAIGQSAFLDFRRHREARFTGPLHPAVPEHRPPLGLTPIEYLRCIPGNQGAHGPAQSIWPQPQTSGPHRQGNAIAAGQIGVMACRTGSVPIAP